MSQKDKKYVPKVIRQPDARNRTFSYSAETPIGKTSLSFTLQTQVPDELIAYRSLLAEGLKDVEEELASFSK